MVSSWKLGSIGAVVAAISSIAATGCLGRSVGAGTKSSADPPSGGVGVVRKSTCVGRDASCTNRIDSLVVPRLAQLGMTPARADAPELCRRLAIDILGRSSSGDELTFCKGTLATKGVEAVVDAWLDLPDHDRTERRNWANLVAYDVSLSNYRYVIDADEIAGALARGVIGYDEFATRLVIHPAFYARHPDDDWSRQIFALFLGRTARADETKALRPLVSVWSGRTVGETRDFREVAFDFCQCELVAGGCVSHALGVPVDLNNLCVKEAPPATKPAKGRTFKRPPPPPPPPSFITMGDPMERNEAKLVRMIDVGDDLALPTPLASARQRAALKSIGAALTRRRDFWEAAVDREMRRYLGWWQTAFKRPESDLPEVRFALATELARSKSIRDLDRTILTSVLYTMPATERSDLSKEAQTVRWTSGPRKLLAGEPWLDSLGMSVGEDLGVCDHRFRSSRFDLSAEESEGNDPSEASGSPYVDPIPIIRRKSTLIDLSTKEPFDYSKAAQLVGGCGGSAPMISSLGLAQSQRELAATICAGGRSMTPSTVKGARLEDDARRVVVRMLGREATDAEATRFAREMRECMTVAPGGAVACDSRVSATRWLCTRIATSTEFGTY